MRLIFLISHKLSKKIFLIFHVNTFDKIKQCQRLIIRSIRLFHIYKNINSDFQIVNKTYIV